ncbi:ImmA/IrrE family metallo-endopeptidase [Altererythrobacter sp. MTPC7]|uniref:ImmA/IrrE family metallo-endopeptidase n=1 Tax=Altererythrobacter sp. MTPC7 TaxID=3056567 RepID=UPI0036F1A2AA
MGILTAEKVIREHQASAPVQTVDIARALGITLFKTKSWPDNISGMIRKDDKSGPSGFTIYVNGNHPRVRRRFTIAHEIAHYALHESLIGDGISDDALYRSGLSSSVETQANRMAADILMPWHLIDEATSQGLGSVEKLARHFDVSRSTMAIQLGVPYDADFTYAAV